MELIEIGLDQLDQHPHNPRREVKNVDELAASIRIMGLLEPLVVAPAAGPQHGLCGVCQYVYALDDEGHLIEHTKNQGKAKRKCDGTGTAPTAERPRYILIAGHRRTAAAKLAEVKTVPAMLRSDLDTEEKQLEAMLVENGHREDLTPMEEAEGYNQLKLFGVKPAEIAAKTGYTKKTVDQRLALMRLPEQTREKIHGRQISLADAAEMVPYASKPELLGRLERSVGSVNFRYELRRIRDEQEQDRRLAKMRKDLLAAMPGLVLIERPPAFGRASVEASVEDVVGPLPIEINPEGMSEEEYDAAEEAAEKARDEEMKQVLAEHFETCEHHAAFISPYGFAVEHVCRQPDVHPGWAERKKALDEAPAFREVHTPEQLEAQRKRDTSSNVRADHVRALLAGPSMPVLPFLRAHVRSLVGSYGYNYDGDDLALVLDLLGIEPPSQKAKDKRTALIREYVDTASTVEELTRVIVAYQLVHAELGAYGSLRTDYAWSDRSGKSDRVGWAGRWISMLEETGYERSDVDGELIAAGQAEYDRRYGIVRPGSGTADSHGEEGDDGEEDTESEVDEDDDAGGGVPAIVDVELPADDVAEEPELVDA